MKSTCLAWLAAGLLLLPGATLAQPNNPTTSSYRAVLGGPPQPGADTAKPVVSTDLVLLRQLPLGAAGTAVRLPLAELARMFPASVRQVGGFRADIGVVATATAVAGARQLVALQLPACSAGVPSPGTATGQRLKLLTASGEQFVAVARSAAAGSRQLLVHAEAGLLGQLVVVVGLEHPAELTLDYEALALLYGRATQQLAQQLGAVQQQLAVLRQQLAATRQLNGALLLDHAEQQDLKQQLNLLRSQQAAAFSAARQRRGTGWQVD